MLHLPKQFVQHSLPLLWKCNNLRDHCNPYKFPGLWLPNSPDLNPIDYKIWVIIHQRVQSTKVQDVKDMWAGVEKSIIQNVIDHRCRHLHTCIQPQKDIMNITVTKISLKIKIKLKFTVKQDTSFRLSLVSWHLRFIKQCSEVYEVWWVL